LRTCVPDPRCPALAGCFLVVPISPCKMPARSLPSAGARSVLLSPD